MVAGASGAGGRCRLLRLAASRAGLRSGDGGPYILAGELHRAAGDYVAPFARSQAIFKLLIRAKQEIALRSAGAFAPKSKFSLSLRNRILNLLGIGWIADLTVGRDLADRMSLPDY